MTTARTEPGSFRDREARIFYLGDEVYRSLSQRGLEAWRGLEQTRFFARALEAGEVVGTEEVELPEEAPVSDAQPWVAALRHERIPFVSYPYEWSFHMLKRAALLHLSLLERALAEDYVLKDSSAYNVQWQGVRPLHIDVGSFEKWKVGEPWVGYRQFCELFLYPLMLNAYRDLAFQRLLRGRLDGIEPAYCSALMSFRDRFRRGVFTHVYLQSRLETMTAKSETSVKKELRKGGFGKQIILNNVRGLAKLVGRLRWRRARSEWAGYVDERNYSEADLEAKRKFVARALGEASPRQVWDLGCNTGEFSRLAADHADYVVAMDGDSLAIDRLFLDLEENGPGKILPLVSDLVDPAPDQGWRLLERRRLEERGRPDYVMALALLHHLVIGRNLPLAEVIDWLESLGGHLVVEFVHREDAMVQKLLLNKEDRYTDYDLGLFREILGRGFEIRRELTFESGRRTIFEARRKGVAS